MTFMLYHREIAPNGMTFEESEESSNSKEQLLKDGWVDHPEKANMNPRNISEEYVNSKYHRYLSSEIPGIDEYDNQTGRKRCLIWNTVAFTISKTGDEEFECVDSLRAGGKYAISRTATEFLKLHDEQLKARLTTWLIKQRVLGIDWPCIKVSTIEDVIRYRNLAIYERSNLLLRFNSNQSSKLGNSVSFSTPDVCSSAIAWSESTDFNEVLRLLGYMVEQNLLQQDKCDIEKYSLTVKGFAKLEKIQNENANSSQAFVAMWFHDSMNDAWNQGIKLGIEDAGYIPLRIDEKEHNRKIDDEIIAEIKRSRFIVADFTQGDERARGGVYYEAGFAHGFNIPVIFTCRKDTLDKVHFDTRQYNHIVWETPEELRRGLANRISAEIGDGPNK